MTRLLSLLVLLSALLGGCATLDGYVPERAITHSTESINVEGSWERAAPYAELSNEEYLAAAERSVNRAEAPAPREVIADVEPQPPALPLGGFIRDVWEPYLNAQAPPLFAQADRNLYTLGSGCSPFNPWSLGGQYSSPPCAARSSFDLALQTTLVPEWSLGSSTPTYTRASTAYQTDFEGKQNLVLSGEARMQGARRVYNLAPTSLETGATTGWGGADSATLTANQSDPEGGTKAILVTRNAVGTSWVSGLQYAANKSYPINGRTIRVSAWLKRAAGTAAIGFGVSDYTAVTQIGPNLQSILVDGAWHYLSFITTSTFTAASVHQAGLSLGANGDAAYVYKFQVEDVTGQANQNPSEHVSVGVLSAPYHGLGIDGTKAFNTTNGNSVASNIVTEAAGVPIVTGAAGVAATAPVDAGGPFGYLAEGARTNLALQSQTLGTTWAQNNVTISSDAVAAPDGTTTADKIVEAATTTTHTVLQTKVGTSGVYTMSVHLKAAERTWAYVTEGNSVNARAYFDLANGVVGQVLGTGSPSATIKALPNGWYRCTLTFTAGANANTQFGPTLADNDTPSYLGDITKGIYAWGAQLELGSFASTYIPTTTVAVTRAADVLTYPSAGNISGTVGSVYAEITGNSSSSVWVLGDAGAAFYITGGNLTLYDGAFRTGNPITLSSTPQKVGGAWGGTTSHTALSGTLSSVLGFDGNMNWSASYGVATYGTLGQLFGTIRNVRIYPVALRADQLQAKTADATEWLGDPWWRYAANDERYYAEIAANDDQYRIAANGRR